MFTKSKEDIAFEDVENFLPRIWRRRACRIQERDRTCSEDCIILSLDSEIFASTQCFRRDLLEKERVIDLVDALAEQLLWAFNVDDPIKKRELIEINSIFEKW